MSESQNINFKATVRQVKNLVDGGLVFIFDVPETSIATAAQLLAVKTAHIVLDITCIADGFTQTKKETEPLTLDQQIQKTEKEIDELESDLEFTD